MTGPVAYRAGALFDGTQMLPGVAVLVEGGRILGLAGPGALPPGARLVDLGDGIVAPGFVDLQVNGGGGVMFNAAPSVDTLRVIAQAHAGLGATTILPTLITDTPVRTRAAIDAAIAATHAGVAGIGGLHLEGPHLSLARKGAHDPALIRPMEPDDLAALLEAARRLPVLKVTVAPENVSREQVAALATAGVLVSLGHTDADFDTCMAYAAAGARCATHLFNAMSQMQNRAPGLVGAVLHNGALSSGLIADGIHVHPAAMAAALRAKRGPGAVFLVSDAMASAGTDLENFDIGGRLVLRRAGRLTLEDGTLAGADLTLATALQVLTGQIGLDVAEALTMATSRPAALAGLAAGRLEPGAQADFIHLDAELALRGVWQNGTRLPD